jgi:hypothetical protein
VLEVLRFEPLIEHRTRDIDVLAEIVEVMASQEKTVEKCGFALRSHRVIIVSKVRHGPYRKNRQYNGEMRIRSSKILLEPP